jgi:CheY-like chemotaxis protein
MSKRILMVEDTEDNRQIIRDLIATTEYELIEAADGAAGIAAATAHRPDLILMDIQLPVIDGYEAARRIKAGPGAPALSDHRRHLLRPVGRRGESPCCWVRWLHCQAIQSAPAAFARYDLRNCNPDHIDDRFR